MSIIQEMKKVKTEENLIGIAASQLGYPDKVCIVKDMVLRNPNIIWYSPETSVDTEGCYSVEGVYEVERSDSIRIRYTTPAGARKTKVLSGYAARIAQHEIDHLQEVSEEKPFGITIADRGKRIR